MPSNGKAIALSYARQLTQNYALNKLGKKLLATDTQAVWFSKEIILTALGLDPATPTPNISGLRFYFGAYEKHPGCPANTYDYDKLTLVMIQTGLNKITIDRNGTAELSYVDIVNEPDPNSRAQPTYPEPAAPVNNRNVYNEGQLRPPPKVTDDLGLLNW